MPTLVVLKEGSRLTDVILMDAVDQRRTWDFAGDPVAVPHPDMAAPRSRDRAVAWLILDPTGQYAFTCLNLFLSGANGQVRL